MIFTQVTPSNSRDMIGKQIVFTAKGQKVLKTVTGVSPSGKTLQLDYPELKNNIQIVSRKVYAVM